jgi:hypothetical protein
LGDNDTNYTKKTLINEDNSFPAIDPARKQAPGLFEPSSKQGFTVDDEDRIEHDNNHMMDTQKSQKTMIEMPKEAPKEVLKDIKSGRGSNDNLFK